MLSTRFFMTVCRIGSLVSMFMTNDLADFYLQNAGMLSLRKCALLKFLSSHAGTSHTRKFKNSLLAPIESSVIPLPHQIRALSRAIANDRVRYLLADEVGLGKTIEAGLIMRELKLRGLVKRTLVIAPKGLVSQWVAEMRAHFNEHFQLVLARRHQDA
jgi:SNF2 family DNA or RNA helicase